MHDQHKLIIHVQSHHHPHQHREAELKRLEGEVSGSDKAKVTAELTRWAKESKLVGKNKLGKECTLLLRAHMEDTEYRALYSAAQLTLCNPHGVRQLSQRFQALWSQIDKCDFGVISPWLANLHKYLSTRIDVYESEVERIDATQAIGRTNEYASLLAECINAVIRHYDDVFASLTRVSRWEPRLVEIVDALEIGLTKLQLVEAQNNIYESAINLGSSGDAPKVLQSVVGKLTDTDKRYTPLYMMGREVGPTSITKDLKLDSDFNTKNIATLKELIKAFGQELKDIQQAKKTTSKDVIEGAIGAAVNECISGMEWDAAVEGVPTKANDLTRTAVRQVLNWRELDRAMRDDKLGEDNKATQKRITESWAIVLSHAVCASDFAYFLRLKSAASAFGNVRQVKGLRELVEG